MPYVKRLLAMHQCTVLIVPKAICRSLGLHPGDYVQLDTILGTPAAYLEKLNLPETNNVRNPRTTARPPR